MRNEMPSKKVRLSTPEIHWIRDKDKIYLAIKLVMMLYFILFSCIFAVSVAAERKMWLSREQDRDYSISDLVQLSRSSRTGHDFPIMLSLKPIKESPYIMYWRPQKVGSSTLLSMLMSYAFRYNLLPRRKESSNAFCRIIAKCALDEHRSSLTAAQEKHLEKFVVRRTSASNKEKEIVRGEKLAAAIPFTISLTHEICNLNYTIIDSNLQCAFNRGQDMATNKIASKSTTLEIFQVREPIARAVSVYYFWGELYKLVQEKKKRSKVGRTNKINKKDFKVKEEEDPDTAASDAKEAKGQTRQIPGKKGVVAVLEGVISNAAEAAAALSPTETAHKKRGRGRRNRKRKNIMEEEGQQRRQLRSNLILGGVTDHAPVEGSSFSYHGDEHTAPSLEYALNYVDSFPYYPGMPGPSYTWSAFANGVHDAVNRIVNNDKLITIVLERLDESLVALSHHLHWSLADVVVLKQRKALSTHPKAKDWPQDAVEEMRKKLLTNGEYQVYNASMLALDTRLQELRVKHKVDVEGEVKQLAALRIRASEWCLNNDTHLLYYRDMLSRVPLPAHASENKLRDVEQKYVDGKHLFSFNRELLCSFDVCAACESHAMLKAVKIGLAKDIESAPALFQLPWSARAGDVNFAHCPTQDSLLPHSKSQD